MTSIAVHTGARTNRPVTNEISVRTVYICHCGMECSCRSMLIRHERTHLPKAFQCSSCSTMFTQKSSLKRHMEQSRCALRGIAGTMVGLAKGKCEPFAVKHPFHFPFPSLVSSPTSAFTKVSTKKVSTKKVSTFTKVSTKASDSRHPCTVCDKFFRTRWSLHVHMRIHTGEKSFKCVDCCRRFRHKSSLTKHMFTHTQSPYKCTVCDREFIQKVHFTSHVCIHAYIRTAGEKSYKCSICHRGFSQKSSIVQHIRTHTGEKPYKCDVCHRGFSQKSNLIRHQRNGNACTRWIASRK